MPDPASWEQQAANWVAWARTPGHDIFPYFAPAFVEEFLPAASGRTLEVGCGEGRLVRSLAAAGHMASGADGSPALARHARGADPQSNYMAANATALPFAEAAFTTVVAYNMLQTMARADDMAQAVREASRVLVPGGHLCICVAHPFSDFSLINEASAARSIDRSSSYFEHQQVNETVTQAGLTMTFTGWTHTLTDYARAIEDADMLIDRIREPVPTEPAVASRRDLERWRRIPLFLFIRAVKH